LEEMTRQEQIHEKGFNLTNGRTPSTEFGNMKIGVKTLEDAIMSLGAIKKANATFSDKAAIIKALGEADSVALREISNYFYKTNGIYRRICEYFAYLYRYDWYIVPENYPDNFNKEKLLKSVN